MRSSTAVAAVGLALFVAGCGSKGASSNGESSKSPTQIIADVKAATATATAVHVVGSGTSNGKPLKLDLYLVAGKGGRGHISEGTLSFDVVRVGGKAYFSGGASFWKQVGGGLATSLFKGRWIEASATQGQLASFTPLTDLRTLINGILSSVGTSSLKKGPSTTVDGSAALTIVDSSASGGSIAIASTGKPYLLQLEAGHGNTGTIVFKEWNKIVDVVAPKNALDFSKLTSGSGG